MSIEAMTPATVNEPGAMYVWPCWWGGVTRSATPPMIATHARELRRMVGSLAAKKQQGGPQFPVRSAKELMQKLAEGLDELGMVAPVVAQEVELVDTNTIPDNKTASGKPVFRTLAHVKSTVRLGAVDGSYVDVVGSGHGGDVDDKAGGKADTYAWKSAILKGLTVPEQDMPDTDDEEPSQTRGGPSDEPPQRRVKVMDAPGPDVGGKIKAPSADGGAKLNDILSQVALADDDGLEKLKDEIVSGRAGLSGADKLKASAAFVKRRAELQKAKETK